VRARLDLWVLIVGLSASALLAWSGMLRPPSPSTSNADAPFYTDRTRWQITHYGDSKGSMLIRNGGVIIENGASQDAVRESLGPPDSRRGTATAEIWEWKREREDQLIAVRFQKIHGAFLMDSALVVGPRRVARRP